MKNLYILDKISLTLIVLNIISAIGFVLQAKTISIAWFVAFLFYRLFVVRIYIVVGVVLNLISIVKKQKSLLINILMIILLVLQIPLYNNIFDYAMSF